MLHHIPVLLEAGAALWACCCGWWPRAGDTSLAAHLHREAGIAKGTRARYDEKIVHLNRVHPNEHLVEWCPDHDEMMIAVRMGEWPEVAARLREFDRGPADRDSGR